MQHTRPRGSEVEREKDGKLDVKKEKDVFSHYIKGECSANNSATSSSWSRRKDYEDFNTSA